MKISTVEKFSIWVYEELDNQYSSQPVFSNHVKEQGAFIKEREAPVLCYHLVESSTKQLFGCKNAHMVIDSMICYFFMYIYICICLHLRCCFSVSPDIVRVTFLSSLTDTYLLFLYWCSTTMI
jgi:hypothetical protein